MMTVLVGCRKQLEAVASKLVDAHGKWSFGGLKGAFSHSAEDVLETEELEEASDCDLKALDGLVEPLGSVAHPQESSCLEVVGIHRQGGAQLRQSAQV